MKRWAILTVLLYALALLLLTVPVALIAFGSWPVRLAETLGETFPKLAPTLNEIVGRWAVNGYGLNDSLKAFSAWGYWVWLGVLLAGQMLLLLLPIHIAEKRPQARRPLKIPIIATAFFLANLVFAGLLAIFCTAFKEEGFGIFGFLTPFKPTEVSPSDMQILVGMIITVSVFWFIWAVVFSHFPRADEPDKLLKRGTRWLLRGSILELLIAVPSHVIVRRRDDCCAPIGTFWGIATGISVMLLCFGPGIFFLFVERFQRLKPKSADQNKPA